jgi:hypothetical protein
LLRRLDEQSFDLCIHPVSPRILRCFILLQLR